MTMNNFDLPLASHMVAPVHTLRDTDGLAHAGRALEQLDVSALPVVDASGRLTGVLERADLLRVGRLRWHAAEGDARWSWPDLRVSECMQTAVPVARPEQPLRDCARRMLDRRLQRVYVLASEQLVGVVSTRELMLAVAEAGIDTPIGQLAAGTAETIAADAPVAAASALLGASSGQPLVVLEGGNPVGVFAPPELRACLEADAAHATRLYMDWHVLALPSEYTAHQAAREAAVARARYIIAVDAALGYRVISGPGFAARVCGVAPAPDAATNAAPLPAPPLPLADAGFGPPVPRVPCPEPARLPASAERSSERAPAAPAPGELGEVSPAKPRTREHT